METMSWLEFQQLLGLPEWQFDERYREARYLAVVEDGFLRFPSWQLNADPMRVHAVLQIFLWNCDDNRVIGAFMEEPHDRFGARSGREAVLDVGFDIRDVVLCAILYAKDAWAQKKASGAEPWL